MSTATTYTKTSPVVHCAKLPEMFGSFNYYDDDRLIEENDLRAFVGKSPHTKAVSLPVQDIRPRIQDFTVDVQGFQVFKHSSRLLPPSSPDESDKFADPDFVKTQYWPEMRSFVKDNLKARSVFVRDTSYRNAAQSTKMDPRNPRAGNRALNPFFIVHGDYTPASGRAHLRAMLPTFFEDNDLISSTTVDERETFMALRAEVLGAEDAAMSASDVSSIYDWDGGNYNGPRYAIFSIWRPLSTVRRDPLAIMDARDLLDSQIIELPRTYNDRPGFVPSYRVNNILVHPPSESEHRWYWLSNQTPEEVYAIKLFDSHGAKGQGVAEFATHSAFELDGVEEQEARVSCELRMLVVW